MSKKLEEQIFAALDGTIDSEAFEELQRTLEQSREARQVYLECVEMFESLGEMDPKGGVAQTPIVPSGRGRRPFQHRVLWFAAAAALLLVCSVVAFSVGRRSVPEDRMVQVQPTVSGSASVETMAAGHASLRRTLDVRWADGTTQYRSGDLIPEGKLEIEEGVIELDFFCGASLVVEGPAELDIKSDWELTCLSGRLRANVPPAAQGFIVNAADSKIIDLGTEFSLRVGDEEAHVEVIDGEVEIQRPAIEPERMTTGQEKWLAGSENSTSRHDQIASSNELERRRTDQLRLARSKWLVASDALRDDQRLIAYYPIEAGIEDVAGQGRRISNAATTGEDPAVHDGFFVGSVARSIGRFGASNTGLEFARPGARVRVRMDGTYDAFTFVAWVKIDSLQHVYNALFMADGYENGEPHWQIEQDGTMMFSVMVDDSAEIIHYSKVEDAMVRGAGRHRIYRTPPIWDLAKSGRWMHLAAVYDPANARVRQFVDGQRVSDAPIEAEWMVRQLHIGAAEIGNWGQPSRKTPSFAVRNLDGTIDELALFNAALEDQEIKDLYEAGKP